MVGLAVLVRPCGKEFDCESTEYGPFEDGEGVSRFAPADRVVGGAMGIDQSQNRAAERDYMPALLAMSMAYWLTKVPAGGSPLPHDPSDSPGRLIHK